MSSVCQIAKREAQLEVLNVTIRNRKLTGTLNMHQRFLVNISNNNIPRLRQLVNVALKNKRNISHIVSKVIDVIDGIYSPNPIKRKQRCSILVLKPGGPCLFDILYRAGKLPSVSTAYRMATNCLPILSSVQQVSGSALKVIS